MGCSDKYNLTGLLWGAVLGGGSGGLIAGSVAHMHPVHLGSATCVICLPVGWVPIWQFGTILPPWQSLHRSQFWVAEIICAPLPGVVRHALYAITLWVVAGSVFSFRTGTRSVGWAVAMGWPWRGCSGCGWCRLLGVPTYRHTAIWALEGFVPVGCVIVGYYLSRYIVFGCTDSVTAIIPA